MTLDSAAFPAPAWQCWETHAKGVDLSGMRIFMTGGTGFVGSWLLAFFDYLHRTGRGPEVTILSRNPDRFLDRRPAFRMASWLSWHHGDVRDYAFPRDRYDLIVHGATGDDVTAQAYGLSIYDTIVDGTRRVLEHGRTSDVGRILLLSSGVVSPEVAGQSATWSGQLPGVHWGMAYSEGKRTMEVLGALHHAGYGQDVVVARLYSFIGQGLASWYAISEFIRDAMVGEAIVVKGSGKSVRAYLYAGDMALWLTRIMREGVAGHVYNVGSDQELDMHGLACLIRDVICPGKLVKTLGEANADNERRVYVPDIGRERDLFGLDVWTRLDEAIASMSVRP